MSDDDALRAAIVAAPDSDLPRLVYADFIQENGDEAGAEFIRAQIELANTPEYEPFAVHLHTHRPELVAGDDRRDHLPRAPGLEWVGKEYTFRRGFGFMVQTAFIPALQSGMPILRAREPVQALVLPSNGLPHQLDELGRSLWMPDIRRVWFGGLRAPTELVRMLCAAPAATGVRELHFTAGSSPAIPVLLEAIFAAPFGRAIESLRLTHSTEDSSELVEAVAAAPALARLTLRSLSRAWQAVDALARSELLARLRVLRLPGSYLFAGNLAELVARPAAAGLEILDLSETDLRESGAEALVASSHLTGLRKLNLSENSLGSDGVQALARGGALAGLRSLLLRLTGTDNTAVEHLSRAPFWSNLVELDLTRNPIDDHGAAHLLSAPTPPEMTALRLSVARFSESMRDDLARKFGPAVRFVADG